jgi:hypothetical protein
MDNNSIIFICMKVQTASLQYALCYLSALLHLQFSHTIGYSLLQISLPRSFKADQLILYNEVIYINSVLLTSVSLY